jgi:Domain of unknown function (DUF4340)
MSSARKPLIYLGVFVVLALFYYFYEHKGGIERAEIEEQSKKALQFSPDIASAFSPDSATVFSITTAGGTVSLERSDDGWQLVSPVAAAADSEAVARLLSSVSDAAHDRVVEDSAADLSVFGLEHPQLTFSVTPIRSGKQQVLQLGNKNPGETFIYARNLDQPGRVVLLNSWLLGDLDRSVFQLRDKRLLRFDKEEVQSLTIIPDGEPEIRLTRNEDRWDIGARQKYRADADSVEAILSQLSAAGTEGFIDQPPDNWESFYQLDQPALTVRLNMEDSSSCGMQFGVRDSSGHYFAVRQDESGKVFLAGAELFDILSANPSRLRDMALVDAKRESITSAEN